MRIRISATWVSLLLVVVALGRPAAPARSAPTPAKPALEIGSVPFDAELWSPAHPTAGGIVFLVNPIDAEIYVNGGYAGRPLQFTPGRPLRLGGGQHRVELVATGYATARLDIGVVPGFVSTVVVVMERW